jgi:predicted dehydrogenase
VLLPILEKTKGISRRTIVTATGPSARRTAERFGFAACGTDPDQVLSDPSVDLVFIATRHDSHAALAEAALRAGKAVWLEKPVGLTMDEVDAVARAVRETNGFLMVGYNRRFSSHARAIREAFAKRSSGPMAIQYVIAAGPTPSGTWLTDPKIGGGRIIGEACHFVDLCTYLVGQVPNGVQARALGRDPETDDSTMMLVSYPDGSTASISYLANASTELSKERFEVHADGKSASCENYRVTVLPGGKKVKGVNQDKGQGGGGSGDDSGGACGRMQTAVVVRVVGQSIPVIVEPVVAYEKRAALGRARGDTQVGSSGWSMKPSPSSSSPLSHGASSLSSLESRTLEQPGSFGKST